MADSKHAMARLERLEGAIVHITDILVLHGERLDSLRSETSERLDSLRSEMNERLDSVRDEMRMTREALAERLDRLIAVTTDERTMGIERLARIEERVARLEARIGT